MSGTSRIGFLATVTAGVIVTVGCVEGIQLHTADTNLTAGSRYVTFFVMPGNPSGNPAVDGSSRRRRDGARESRTGRNLARRSEAVVIPHIATSAIHSRDAFYRGWGGWAWHATDAQSRNGTESYKPGLSSWTSSMRGRRSSSGTGQRMRPSLWTRPRARTRSTGGGQSLQGLPAGRSREACRNGWWATSPVTPSQPMRILFSSGPAYSFVSTASRSTKTWTEQSCQRMTNADAFILRDESGIHYVSIGGRWLEASEISGSWSLAGTVPEGADLARQAYTTRHPDPYASVQPHGPARWCMSRSRRRN
jgi:hypothetical protein